MGFKPIIMTDFAYFLIKRAVLKEFFKRPTFGLGLASSALLCLNLTRVDSSIKKQEKGIQKSNLLQLLEPFSSFHHSN